MSVNIYGYFGEKRQIAFHRGRNWVGALASTWAAVGTAGVVYRHAFRPWHRSWGATDEEAAMALPGDDMVERPAYQTTRAISIHTPPDEIWPWLVQMGQHRAGFYSYDWIENLFGLEIHNADQIVRAWQQLDVGDTVWMSPPERFGGNARVRVVEVIPQRALVLGPVEAPDDRSMAERTGEGTWAFVLAPVDEYTTRLIARTRSHRWNVPRPVFAFYDLVHFIMERKMLLGIKQRAESAHAHEVEEPGRGAVQHERAA